MKLLIPVIVLMLFPLHAPAQQTLPIIDMHMHVRPANHYGTPPMLLCAPPINMPRWDPAEPIEGIFEPRPEDAPCPHPHWSPETDDEVFQQTIEVMEKHNIYGMLGGQPEQVTAWTQAAPGRFIPGLDFRLDRATGTATPGAAEAAKTYQPLTPAAMRELYEAGTFQVLAEVLNAFGGIAPDDERMAPYWALAEELDFPVGIHIGLGAPGEFYLGNHGFRASLQSALTLENVLVRYPRLRVYIMHAGYPFLDDTRALLFSCPQVYVEVGIVANLEPRPAFHRFLQGIVESGYGDRVMFGSDGTIWPGLIEVAIDAIEEAPFLTDEQKRDIFYNNAARFLRLGEEEIARHQGRQVVVSDWA